MHTDVLTGQWAGEEAWVLGNGPSLNGLHRLIPPRRSIGTNRILKWTEARDLPAPEYLLMVDWQVWKDERERVIRSESQLIVGAALLQTSREMELPVPEDASIFSTRLHACPAIPYGHLRHGFLSGYYAAELAARMVYPNGTVVLAGMDLRIPKEGPSHCYGDGKEHGAVGGKFAEGIEAMCHLKDVMHLISFEVAGDSALLDRGFERWV